MTWINALLIYFYVLLAGVALTNSQTCRNTGSLDYQDGTLFVLATTYVIPSYRIPCDGVVVGWEFCYQILNVPSVTFYPSVWRCNGNDRYTLVHASAVTYVPQLGGAVFICDNYTLPADQQISVLTNDTIGLYTTTRSNILTTSESNDTLAYSAEGNQSSIIITGDAGFVTQQRFHVAIVAEIRDTASTSTTITRSSSRPTILQTTSIVTTGSTSSPVTSTSIVQVLSMSTLVSLSLSSTTSPNLITISTSTSLSLVTSTVSTSTESVLLESTTPSTSMTPAGAADGTSDTNNTSVIIGAAVGVAVAILVALTIVLVFVVVMYKRRTSTSASYSMKMQSATDKRVEGTRTTEVISGKDSSVNPNPAYDTTDQSNNNTLHMYDTLKYEVVLDRNPAYGAIPEQKKEKGHYDYVVSTEEMIKTDTNPSYVPISVGDNVLDDNPSYQTV